MTGSGYGTIRGGEPEPEQVTIYYLQGVSINYKLGLRAIKMHQIFALRPNLLVTVYRNTLYMVHFIFILDANSSVLSKQIVDAKLLTVWK